MNGEEQEGTHRTIERVARESYGRLVAYLSAHTRDVASAEDALSNALVKALTTWPRDGVPQNPEAWLLTAAILLCSLPARPQVLNLAFQLSRKATIGFTLAARRAGI
jgi:hypothetical protein